MQPLRRPPPRLNIHKHHILSMRFLVLNDLHVPRRRDASREQVQGVGLARDLEYDAGRGGGGGVPGEGTFEAGEEFAVGGGGPGCCCVAVFLVNGGELRLVIIN